MNAIVLRGDARALPLPDASVDLIVTSPPYFGLRSYTDGCPACAERARAGNRGYMERYCPGCGKIRNRNVCPECGLTTLRTEATKAANRKTDCDECGGTGQLHYDGQIGSEATPQEWVAALVECTREWMRVLRPSGSMFVNLGDKFAGAAGPGTRLQGNHHPKHNDDPQPRGTTMRGMRDKSLLGLPWRYALACTDHLGLILRRDIIWAKPNGLPESVTDRCRSSHEYVFHLVKQPRYYAAVDEIREPHVIGNGGRQRAAARGEWYDRKDYHDGERLGLSDERALHPLGKLPGSVWNIASQPLTVPAHLGVDHFAAFPMELPRRCVLGWSPPGICTACGEGRRPVASAAYTVQDRLPDRRGATMAANGSGTPGSGQWDMITRQHGRATRQTTITGYTCNCTKEVMPDGTVDERDSSTSPGSLRDVRGAPSGAPPTRPAIVLDPFGGTGTTALVATMLGRTGVSIDRSADYTRLARWRCQDPGERAKALQVPKPPKQLDGQEPLWPATVFGGQDSLWP